MNDREEYYPIKTKKDLFSNNRKYLKNKIEHNFNDRFSIENVNDKTRKKLSEINRSGILISEYLPTFNIKNELLKNALLSHKKLSYYACKQKNYISFYIKNKFISNIEFFIKDFNSKKYINNIKLYYLICTKDNKLTNIDDVYFVCKDKSYLNLNKYNNTKWRYYKEINIQKNYQDYLEKDFYHLQEFKTEFYDKYCYVQIISNYNKLKLEKFILEFINLYFDY